MKPLYLDCETTAKPLHDPFNPRAKLCYVGLDDDRDYVDYSIEYSDEPYGANIHAINEKVRRAELLVGANPKFDLHWLRRYGVDFSGKQVWDVLLVQFILNNQTTPYGSLNAVCAAWGLGQKLDVVKTEYWDKGLDTKDVPEDILRPYLETDVQLTKQVFKLQYAEVVKRGILPLVTIHNLDLLMLEEMEWNGNKYDVRGSRHEAAVELLEIRKLKRELNQYTPIKPRKWSPDFLSLLLYGGTYKYVVKEAYPFTYKDGSTKEKWHNVVKEYPLPRLVEPPKKARAKEGFWPTDEATLKKLKTKGVATKIVRCLLIVREKEKLVGTYLKGFPSKIQQAEWEHETIHTNYNQAVAVTGRLSSDKPNVQNNPPEQKPYFITRFGESNESKE